MEDLTTWQGALVAISFICISIGLWRIIIGIGDYLMEKAKYYRIKIRILKAKNKDIFNKWYD